MRQTGRTTRMILAAASKAVKSSGFKAYIVVMDHSQVSRLKKTWSVLLDIGVEFVSASSLGDSFCWDLLEFRGCRGRVFIDHLVFEAKARDDAKRIERLEAEIKELHCRRRIMIQKSQEYNL